MSIKYGAIIKDAITITQVNFTHLGHIWFFHFEKGEHPDVLPSTVAIWRIKYKTPHQ